MGHTMVMVNGPFRRVGDIFLARERIEATKPANLFRIRLISIVVTRGLIQRASIRYGRARRLTSRRLP